LGETEGICQLQGGVGEGFGVALERGRRVLPGWIGRDGEGGCGGMMMLIMCLKYAKIIKFRKNVLSYCVIWNRYHGYSVFTTLLP
jgi:hypothetical protein